jgi:hypothetical protein
MKERRKLVRYRLVDQFGSTLVSLACNGSTSDNNRKTNMPITKEAAFNQARATLGASASVDRVIAEADKIIAYINGTATVTKAAPPPVNKTPVPYFVVEYKNRKDNGTHFGKKHYKTYNGAMKNARASWNANSARRDRATRFVRVLKVAAA